MFLRKLRKFLTFSGGKAQSGFQLPLNLSAADFIALQRLVRTEEFKLLSTTLDSYLTLLGEQLLAESDSAKIHFLRGKILGIRHAVEFVDELKLKEAHFAATESSRTKSSSEERARAATFGTPGWNNSTRSRA